jgi:peptide/nickel transport system permease protein
MVKFILKRLISSLPVLIGVTLFTFILTNIIPGDPALSVAGQYASKEQVEAVREQLGLDKPLPVQYINYLNRLIHGDLGKSILTSKPVAKELGYYFPATLELMLVAITLTTIIGIPLGVIAAVNQRPWIKSSIMLFSLLGVGIPVFWAGLVAQIVFYGKFNLLPASGRLGPGIIPPPSFTRMYSVDALFAGQWTVFFDAIKHLLLPGLILALGRIASVARITHSSMLVVMREDYIRTARSKGLKESLVIINHALKNALLPVFTTIGLQVGWLLAGALLVENIFAWGGIGTYAWISIIQLDLPAVMGITLLTTITFLSVNLLTDISYTILDPRITYS